MQRVDSLDAIQLDQPSIVTIGVFDGVHVGHQTLIKHLVDRAHQTDKLAVVISFYPHPDTVLHGITGRYYLTTLDEKARLMEALGVDVLVIHPFDDTVRHIRAADFVDRLKKHLNIFRILGNSEFRDGVSARREYRVSARTRANQRFFCAYHRPCTPADQRRENF